MVEIKYIVRTKKFDRETKAIRTSDWKNKIKNKIKKIIENPLVGKPLRYDLHGERTIRMDNYRLIYSVQDDTLYLLRLEHRKGVYR